MGSIKSKYDAAVSRHLNGDFRGASTKKIIVRIIVFNAKRLIMKKINVSCIVHFNLNALLSTHCRKKNYFSLDLIKKKKIFSRNICFREKFAK